MADQWEKARWIFERDGALRDIYVQYTNLDDWLHVIDGLNSNYTLVYGPGETGEKITRIDPEYIAKYLCRQVEEGSSASIEVGDIIINCHFFAVDEIEFDVAPEEISNEHAFKLLLDFMRDISRFTQKSVIFTQENAICFPLIIVNAHKNLIKILSRQEHQQNLAVYKQELPLRKKLKGVFMRLVFNLLPKIKNPTLQEWSINFTIRMSEATKPYKDREKRLYSSDSDS